MKVAQCLHKYGICMIRDPRVNEQDNEEYIDMMEEYFEQVGSQFYGGGKVDDIHPECMYQAGATPEKIEIARDHSELRERVGFTGENEPVSPMIPVHD